MKRYMVTGHTKEGKGAERRKELKKGLRKTSFDLSGEGRVIFLGELEEEGSCMIVECEGSAEEFLADYHTIADVEIKPIKLCPKDCTRHPQPSLVAPLREP